MDAKMLAKFKKMLVSERERILKATNQNAREAIMISPEDLPDETDLAATEISQNLAFQLRDRERRVLKEITVALQRIDEGSFNECEDCSSPIGSRRLEVRPFTRLCIQCAEMHEHRQKIYA